MVLILAFILKKIFINKKFTNKASINMSLIPLHPILKYYTLSSFTTLLRYKSLLPTLVSNQLYKKSLILGASKLASKLRHTKRMPLLHRKVKTVEPLGSNSLVNYKFFNTYKQFFQKNLVPLVGGTPSYYLSDIKPLKTWKFLSIFLKSGDINQTPVRLKPRMLKLRHSDFKKTVCKKMRLRLMRSLLNKNLKYLTLTNSILNFKSLAKRLTKFKPLLRRLVAPVYVTKWKNSYPLMFTGNMFTNKLLKPQIDYTIKTFIQSRNNKRVRRLKKIIFRKIKRLGKNKRLNVHTTLSVRDQKRKILSRILKGRFKSRKALVVVKTPYSVKTQTKSTQNLCITSTTENLRGAHHVVDHQTYWSTSEDDGYVTGDVYNNIDSWQSFLLRTTKKTTNKLLQIKQRFASTTHKYTPNNQRPSHSLKKNTQPYLYPRTNKSFVFKNFGIFLTSFMFFNQVKPFTYKHLLKKKIFSFLYPNEVRNALMARKKKIVFYQLVYKIKHRSKKKSHHSFASFNKFFLNHYRTSMQNVANVSSMTHELFSKLSTRNSSTLVNYVTSRDEVLYDKNFIYRGIDLSFKRSEVKIPRIRFRPGYQRMWRNARNALKESMGLKFVYQQQLTRHLVRFYKNSSKYSFARSEMSANRIIMYSRLLPDNPTVTIFIDQKLVYLNGRLLHMHQTILVPNDLVQLVVSLWYYVVYRWISNWTLKRHKKFKKLVYRKGLAGKHKVMKLKKQRSYYTPNWIYLARYDISDIKPFLEVDYLTLSTFVLYEPFTTYYYTPDEAPDFRPNIFRMYNWKYIT